MDFFVAIAFIFLSKYQWYRKWRGGIWYYNREICDMGRTVIFRWERHNHDTKNFSWTTMTMKTIYTEDYTWKIRDKKINKIIK